MQLLDREAVVMAIAIKSAAPASAANAIAVIAAAAEPHPLLQPTSSALARRRELHQTSKASLTISCFI